MSAITIPPAVRTRLRDARIPAHAWMVAVHLLVDTDDKGWRTCHALADDTLMTTHQIRQSARALAKAGLIERHRRYANINGRKTTTTSYRLKGGVR
ncbi:hypothetical protein GTY75_08620 [Streptomyces sp. SID8381]|uniref:hypothetical protein n=1 Tax=unclassified Streptomyces TaxID=2593676 RepID=UPI00036C4BC6|nr:MULTISPECIES: hypothetical protein [unclassified Streptomyces]MYX26731.1 hypothetical protein [Streptomyces sp. SID8381]